VASDLLNASLPPVQWSSGTTPREPRQEPGNKEKKVRKMRPQARTRAAAEREIEEPEIENGEKTAHELDSFA
jgi:hypothetical protein